MVEILVSIYLIWSLGLWQSPFIWSVNNCLGIFQRNAKTNKNVIKTLKLGSSLEGWKCCILVMLIFHSSYVTSGLEWASVRQRSFSIPQQEPLQSVIVPVFRCNLFLRITTVQFLDVCALQCSFRIAPQSPVPVRYQSECHGQTAIYEMLVGGACFEMRFWALAFFPRSYLCIVLDHSCVQLHNYTHITQLSGMVNNKRVVMM